MATKVIESHRYRIYPTAEQEEILFQTIGCSRKVSNLMLDDFIEIHSDYSEGKITEDEKRYLQNQIRPTKYKKMEEYSYLNDVDSLALGYAYKHMQQAFKNFLAQENVGYPKHKARNTSKWSYTTCRSSKKAKNVRLTKHGLKLPKIPGYVKTIVHQNWRGNLVSVTITKERDGKWYAACRFEVNDATVAVFPETLQEITSPVGIDLGIKELAILSDGKHYENKKEQYKLKKKIARLDRKLSRQREQAKKDNRKLSESKNYQKTLEKRNKLHAKVKNRRQDWLHKVTTDIVNNHDFIGLENLSSKNLMKNHHLAYAIADASWNEFKTFLEYKAEKQGTVISYIDRFYASTQTCFDCKAKTGPKGLSQLHVREWECCDCGAVHDRDVNAALNILEKALHVFLETHVTNNDTAGIAGTVKDFLNVLKSGLVSSFRHKQES